jgi:hypothetical protein
MYPKRWHVIATLIALAVVAVIAYRSIDQTIQRSAERVLYAELFEESPCAAPCWQNITPGEVITVAEIEETLANLSSVGRVWTSERGVEFTWKHLEPDTMFTNIVVVEQTTVTSIYLQLAYISVNDVIANYGTPQAITTFFDPLPERPTVDIAMHYPTRGLRFHLEVSSFDPTIAPTTPVLTAVYLEPARSFDAWLGSQEPGFTWYPWPGYGRIPNEMIK